MFIGAAGQTTAEPRGAVVMELNASFNKKKFQPNMKKTVGNGKLQ